MCVTSSNGSSIQPCGCRQDTLKPSSPQRRVCHHSPFFPPHPLDSLGSISTGFILPIEGYVQQHSYSDQPSRYRSQMAFRWPLPAESRVNSHHHHHQLPCGGVQIAGGGLPDLPLGSQPKGKCHRFLRERVAGSPVVRAHSLPLAQGLP